jgi:hypothetical protein
MSTETNPPTTNNEHHEAEDPASEAEPAAMDISSSESEDSDNEEEDGAEWRYFCCRCEMGYTFPADAAQICPRCGHAGDQGCGGCIAYPVRITAVLGLEEGVKVEYEEHGILDEFEGMEEEDEDEQEREERWMR